MNNQKLEKLKKYIKDFYKCDIACIENQQSLLIKVTCFNEQYKKAFKLTCMEKLERYEVVGVEDMEYNDVSLI